MLIVYGITTLLHYFLPGRNIKGYCCDNITNQPLQYKLNGILVYFISVILFYQFPNEIQLLFYHNYWRNLFMVNLLGLGVSFYFFFKGGEEKYTRCVTVDQIKDRETLKSLKIADNSKITPLTRFYLGSLWNPRLFGIDIKMLLYLIGAIGLQINILACVIAQKALWSGTLSNAMLVYICCFGWFIIEYLFGEEVHLYTYDLFAEKIGFKLSWGCLVFYPFFYCIGCFSLVNTKPDEDLSLEICILIVLLYLFGWILTRGANMQKFYFRKYPTKDTFLFGIINQKTIPGTRILVSGYWGLSRHINYLGEIIQAFALALPGVLVGTSISYRLLPLLYPIYYILLFVPRQIDDDEVCKTKYGKAWDEYTKKVPYRICPGLW